MTSRPEVTWTLVLALCGLGLSACGTVRDEMGLSRSKPDEFAVVPRAPLAMPPDFTTLREPAPGTPRPQQLSPAGEARAALAQSRSVPATPGSATTSAGEAALIEAAGADKTDGKIRSQLMDELREARAPKSMTERVMFWQATPVANQEWVVDAAAEARRIEWAKKNGEPVTGKGVPVIEKSAEKGLMGTIF